MKNYVRVGILATICVVFYYLANYVFISMSKSSAASGAFWGAFFSSMFVIGLSAASRFVERRRTHYNAVVKLEYFTNEWLSVAAYNIANLNGFYGSIDRSQNSKQIIVQYLALKKFKVNVETLLGIQDVKLVNAVFNLSVDLDYINDNQLSLLDMYSDMRNRYLSDVHKGGEQRTYPPEMYRKELLRMQTPVGALRESLVDAQHDLITLFAKVRLTLEQNILFARVFNCDSGYNEIKVKEMRDRIELEIKMVADEQGKRGRG